MNTLHLDSIPNGECYSILNNHIRGELVTTPQYSRNLFFSKSNKKTPKVINYGFKGQLRINRNGQFDNILFFDYKLSTESGSKVSLDFEFPCHEMYLPSTTNYKDPRLRLSISVCYEIYAGNDKWTLLYQGKNLENTHMDTPWLWNDLNFNNCKLGVKRYCNVQSPINTQFQLITEKFKLKRLHLQLDTELIVTVMHQKSLSFNNKKIGIIDWENDQDKSILDIVKTPMWCDCSILDLLQTNSQLIIGCEFEYMENDIIWVSTCASFDFLIKERPPPGYEGNHALDSVLNLDSLPEYDNIIDPPQYNA